MDPDLLAAIELSNPWLKQPEAFYERAESVLPGSWITRRTAAPSGWPVPGKANLLVGARQVGKSSVIWRLCLERRTPALVLSGEEPRLVSWAAASPAAVHEGLRNLLRPGWAVFFEEAQHFDNAGLMLKALVDGRLPHDILVTGSSAFHLRARTRESLAGRARRRKLHPLALDELPLPDPSAPPLLQASARRELALRAMVIGGYPEVWRSDAPETELRSLLEAFVIRDASDLFRIQSLDAFRRLLQLVAGQVGSLSNRSEWASLCEVSSDTVGSYLDILEETQLLQRVMPFAGGKRAELTARPKVYFADPGIRNVILRRLTPFDERADAVDRGAVFESWVAAELRKHLDPLLPGDELRYWRTRSGAEVDFVIPRPDGILAYECKATRLRRPKLSRSARSFIDAYTPRAFYVVNLTLEHSERLGHTDVHWVPPERFAHPETLGLPPRHDWL